MWQGDAFLLPKQKVFVQNKQADKLDLVVELASILHLSHGDNAACLENLVNHLGIGDRAVGLVELPLTFTPLPVHPPFATECLHFIQTFAFLILYSLVEVNQAIK